MSSKKSIRPSPSLSAKDWCGHRKKGHDGKYWVSKADTNGVCRWIRSSAKNKGTGSGVRKYYTHFNGGNPFRVDVISPHEVKIFEPEVDETLDDRLIYHFRNLKRIMIGKSPLIPMTELTGSHGRALDGNTILLETEQAYTYILIYDRVRQFSTPDKIVKFVSPMGPNDVPYPYAMDKKERFYIFTESVILDYVPQSERQDPVEYWYNNDPKFHRNGVIREHSEIAYTAILTPDPI